MMCKAGRAVMVWMASRMQSGNACGGFSYLGLLCLIALASVGMSVVGIVWQIEAQREKEQMLLFVGDEYRRAIQSYAEATPAGHPQYPETLEALVKDARYPYIKRHLRRLYSDPMTGSKEWGLVKIQNRISGVFSLSDKAPIKKSGFPEIYETFAVASDYRDWKFIYVPGSTYRLAPVP